METPCRPRRKKKTHRQQTRGRQLWWETKNNNGLFFFLTSSVDSLCDGDSLCLDSDWGCGEEDFQDGEDMLCNTVLITGPTGVGKTAAVYACAQELGFKVQSCRDSRL